MNEEFLSLVRDFKQHLIGEQGTVKKAPRPPEKAFYKPIQTSAPKIEPAKKAPPPPAPKAPDAPVTLEPFRAEVPSEREKMVATIRKVCPSLTLVDQIPSFEEITLPVVFLYKTDAEKVFLSKVAEALKARGIEVLLSDEPIPKARLTVAAKGVSHEADINLEEVNLYEQDTLLKRALWEKLKSSLGISK